MGGLVAHPDADGNQLAQSARKRYISRMRIQDEPLDKPLYVRMTASQREKLRKRVKSDGFRSEGEWVRKILEKELAVR